MTSSSSLSEQERKRPLSSQDKPANSVGPQPKARSQAPRFSVTSRATTAAKSPLSQVTSCADTESHASKGDLTIADVLSTEVTQETVDLFRDRREQERRELIANGHIDDPERPRNLTEALRFLGTCRLKCPPFECVVRLFNGAIDACEKDPATGDRNYQLMVKEYRRSAAGIEAPIPSDVRPPDVLKTTLEYLINDILDHDQPLESVHKFLWNRTRSIRQDFTFQNISDSAEIALAIDCFEYIARFHILCLHRFSLPNVGRTDFVEQQEYEQLSKTLTSLMEFYDDSRIQGLSCPNEPEFRAYHIISRMREQDVEQQAQTWPANIFEDPKVQIALHLYSAAQVTARYSTRSDVSQGFHTRYWATIKSPTVTYLMGALAGMHAFSVRISATDSLLAAYRTRQKTFDWSLKDLCEPLGLSTAEEVAQYCNSKKLDVETRDDGSLSLALDFTSTFDSDKEETRYSNAIIEAKRAGRSARMIIYGVGEPLPERPALEQISVIPACYDSALMHRECPQHDQHAENSPELRVQAESSILAVSQALSNPQSSCANASELSYAEANAPSASTLFASPVASSSYSRPDAAVRSSPSPTWQFSEGESERGSPVVIHKPAEEKSSTTEYDKARSNLGIIDQPVVFSKHSQPTDSTGSDQRSHHPNRAMSISEIRSRPATNCVHQLYEHERRSELVEENRADCATISSTPPKARNDSRVERSCDAFDNRFDGPKERDADLTSAHRQASLLDERLPGEACSPLRTLRRSESSVHLGAEQLGMRLSYSSPSYPLSSFTEYVLFGKEGIFDQHFSFKLLVEETELRGLIALEAARRSRDREFTLNLQRRAIGSWRETAYLTGLKRRAHSRRAIREHSSITSLVSTKIRVTEPQFRGVSAMRHGKKRRKLEDSRAAKYTDSCTEAARDPVHAQYQNDEEPGGHHANFVDTAPRQESIGPDIPNSSVWSDECPRSPMDSLGHRYPNQTRTVYFRRKARGYQLSKGTSVLSSEILFEQQTEGNRSDTSVETRKDLLREPVFSAADYHRSMDCTDPLLTASHDPLTDKILFDMAESVSDDLLTAIDYFQDHSIAKLCLGMSQDEDVCSTASQ